jgi:HEAT repeat protein
VIVQNDDGGIALNADFKAKLETIVELSNPVSRPKIKENLVRLLSLGAESLESLIAILKDQAIEDDIRLLVCWILGQLGDKKAGKPLLEIFRGENISLSLEAAKSLGMLKSKRAVPSLIEELIKGDNVDKRAASAYALGLLLDERAIDALLSVMNNKNDSPKVRGGTAEALIGFGKKRKRVVDALINGLEDPSVEVRFWSTFALGEMKVKRAISKLEKLAAEDDEVLPGWWSVGKEASNAIDRIKSRSSGN